ncbi:MAG: molecular chaperone HtpG [Candidatus Rokubacteria bacterium]|nr:molecular chaperone HtpG [Candidatus Rokubacteria bacterium]
MSTGTERHEFQTEVRELLDLMIHSLYSHKDIFLRELISNASDALDKLRFEMLSRPELTPEGELEIRLEADKDARTLSVHDNGIGMSRDEVVANIGTIARSGTREFLRAMHDSAAAEGPDSLRDRSVGGLGGASRAPQEMIGQFGVGFYSSFMVADRITLVTRRAGEATATRWESTGDGYTLDDAERVSAGTTVTLHLKPKDEEDGLKDYTDALTLKDIVKRYSDFVTYPIRLKAETLNSMKAIWARGKDEITEEEHREFYKHISHDWNDPLEHISVHVEGNFEARALLYIPSKAPFDLHMRDGVHRGLQLFVKRVFIMDDWRELLPPYLRFVRGVVASDDLSLNVSREILQKDRQVQAIKRHLVRRILAALKEMKEQRPETYGTFWTEFGAVLKEGMISFEDSHDKILDLVLAPSTESAPPIGLKDYVARMKDGQDAIYYMTGTSRDAAARSPHLEAFRARGWEVLFFVDPVDELWLRLPRQFEGKTLVSAATSDLKIGTDEEKAREEEARKASEESLKDVLLALRAALQDEVKDVRLSTRLTESPACLVGDAGDLSPQMQELLRRAGQEVPKVKRVLELNPNHQVMTKLRQLHALDAKDPRLAMYAELLYGQALLAEGGALPDPAAFSRRLTELMLQT